MDLQARKLVFIEEYVRLADEKIVLKLEKLLRSEKEKAIKLGLSPLTQTELDSMIEESESDIQKGNVLTHQAVKKTVLNWRTSKK
jgi:low affinity Fe/Cu permease